MEEQYKLYVEMADRISARRSTANAFHLSANSLLLGAVSVLAGLELEAKQFGYLITVGCVVGLIFSFHWYSLLRSYRNLNSGKYAVINEIETKLSIRPYAAEWEYLDRGMKRSTYWPLTHVEQGIPIAFGLLYLLVAAMFLLGMAC